jgi:hypothetical protein
MAEIGSILRWVSLFVCDQKTLSFDTREQGVQFRLSRSKSHGTAYNSLVDQSTKRRFRDLADKVTCKGIRGRGELHCLSRDESRRAYKASHLR